jgi:competence ComEA-like helix-hairpin-helix protein
MFSRLTRRIQTRLGLTKSEAGVILFLSFGLIIGGAAKILKLDKATERYDFSQSDSLFEAASSRIDSIIAVEEDTLNPANGGRTATKPHVDFPLDLNKATLIQLTALPGVGKGTAQKILNFRSSNSRFNTVEDLLKIEGIGPKKYQKIKPLVKID